MHLIMPTILLCSVLLKLLLSTMHAIPCHNKDAKKEEIRVGYNQDKEMMAVIITGVICTQRQEKPIVHY